MKKVLYVLSVCLLIACSTETEKLNTSTTNNQNVPDSAVITKVAEIPQALLQEAQVYIVNPQKDTVLLLGKEGSQIHIPKNAFVYTNGEPVNVPVKISITEYRNAAEMAFSQIPMTYTNTRGEEYNFNSAGMFNITGKTRSGTSINIAKDKPLRVDYKLARNEKGIDFYMLDSSMGEWKQIQKIKPLAQTQPIKVGQQPAKNKANKGIHFTTTIPRRPNCVLWYPGESDEEKVKLETRMTNNYKVSDSLVSFFANNPYQTIGVLFTVDMATGKLENVRADARNQVKTFDDELVAMVNELPACKLTKRKYKADSPFKDVYQLHLHGNQWREVYMKKNSKGKLIDRTGVKFYGKYVGADSARRRAQRAAFKRYRSSDAYKQAMAGHYYPAIVQGLRVGSFGVYNCDQIYRLQNRVTINATYLNEVGDTIADYQVLSMIDRSINGAFSFYPGLFTCNAKADNVLLLFTDSDKIYLLSSEAFKKQQIDESGAYTFTMQDVTASLNSTEKLADYLKING